MDFVAKLHIKLIEVPDNLQYLYVESITMGNMTASQLKSIKSRIKSEMLRRCHNGSVSVYGGASYDFTIEPVGGGQY